MTDLLFKAKENARNERIGNGIVKYVRSLPPKQQEEVVMMLWLTAIENASLDLMSIRWKMGHDLAKVSGGEKPKKSVSKIEQAIVKTFKSNPHLLETLGDLDDVAREGIIGVLEKHLPGQHNQKRHGNRDEETPSLEAGISIKDALDPGDASEAVAIFLRFPPNIAAKIGDAGATVNNYLNQRSGALGRRIWGVGAKVGDMALGLQPVRDVLEIGELVQQHGPKVLRGGIRNYYRYSGNERDVELTVMPGSPRYAVRNQLVQELSKGLPGKRSALTSAQNIPSEGYIIDQNGEVRVRAIGRGGPNPADNRPPDFYLPFTLSQLKAAQGGSLVRRRVWGGPTEEDIRTGLMLGAKDVTVISNTGAYTVRFSGEKKGVDGELPLILNRLTELRGQNKSTHDGTMNILESLSREFPIHFRAFSPDDSSSHQKGPLASINAETGRPKAGFLSQLMDDFQDVLNADGGTARERREARTVDPGDDSSSGKSGNRGGGFRSGSGGSGGGKSDDEYRSTAPIRPTGRSAGYTDFYDLPSVIQDELVQGVRSTTDRHINEQIREVRRRLGNNDRERVANMIAGLDPDGNYIDDDDYEGDIEGFFNSFGEPNPSDLDRIRDEE